MAWLSAPSLPYSAEGHRESQPIHQAVGNSPGLQRAFSPPQGLNRSAYEQTPSLNLSYRQCPSSEYRHVSPETLQSYCMKKSPETDSGKGAKLLDRTFLPRQTPCRPY